MIDTIENQLCVREPPVCVREPPVCLREPLVCLREQGSLLSVRGCLQCASSVCVYMAFTPLSLIYEAEE